MAWLQRRHLVSTVDAGPWPRGADAELAEDLRDLASRLRSTERSPRRLQASGRDHPRTISTRLGRVTHWRWHRARPIMTPTSYIPSSCAQASVRPWIKAFTRPNARRRRTGSTLDGCDRWARICKRPTAADLRHGSECLPFQRVPVLYGAARTASCTTASRCVIGAELVEAMRHVEGCR
jgi:hypothetical protein